MSVYDELIQFQNIPDAYDNWWEYRQQITEYIMEKTKPCSTAVILGAGYCNDFDLSLLSSHFSKLTLVDQNLDAMHEALKKYKLPSSSNIEFIRENFTGITENDYRSFSEELQAMINVNGANTSIHTLADYACFRLQKLFARSESHNLDLGENTYDYSITFGVHSQLCNMPAWIWSAYAAQLNGTSTDVHACIKKATPILVHNFNQSIRRMTKHTAFIANEYSSSLQDTPIEGAYQCILELQKDAPVIEQALVPWPFSVKDGIIYQMLIQSIACD